MAEKNHEIRRDPIELRPKEDRRNDTKQKLGQTAITGRDQGTKKKLGKLSVKDSRRG